MPIYEYACETCGEIAEVWFRTLNEQREVRCERCGSASMRRLVTAPALVHSSPGQETHQPAPGELRVADGERLTLDVARRYAAQTGDSAIKEVARQVERGEAPTTIKEFVSGVKAERAARATKRGKAG